MYTKTKLEILNFLNENTADFIKNNLKFFSANHISSELNISRSLASQYLNELYKENELIKINSRPVIFFSKKKFEYLSGTSLAKSSFADKNEFYSILNSNKKNFSNMIGADLSLRNCIERIKKALYDCNHLPIVLEGDPGSGKTFLANLVYEYCIKNNIIDSQEKLHSISCNYYTSSNDELISLIFGEVRYEDGVKKVKQGLLEKNGFGMILLDDIVQLEDNLQEKFVRYFDTGEFQRVNDNEIVSSCSCILFITNNDAKEVFNNHLLTRLPWVIRIPPLKERSIEEKREFILSFLKKKELKSQYKYKVSDVVIENLLSMDIDNNIICLRNIVNETISNALINNLPDSKEVSIGVSHLPYSISKDILERNVEKFYYLNEYNSKIEQSKGLISGQVLNICNEVVGEKKDVDKSIDDLSELVNKFNDFLIFKSKYITDDLTYIDEIMNTTISILGNKYNIKINANSKKLICRYLYNQSYYNSFYHVEDKNNELGEYLKSIKGKFPTETIVVDKMKEIISKNFGITFSKIMEITTIICIHLNNDKLVKTKKACLIICHGYSTASSIANAANTLIGTKIYDSIDMPLDTPTKLVVTKINEYIKEHYFIEELIVLVDMGSLESVGEKIDKHTSLDIGIINNISTALAVDIGFMVKNEMNIKDILESACSKNKCRYKIMTKRKCEKAIIFTSESGLNTADKMKELFVKSMPKKIPLRLESCDYFQLSKKKEKHELIMKYHVSFVAGIFNPDIKDIKFIGIGDIINFNAIEEIDEVLSEFLNEDEIEEFNTKLIKNFSLQSVVENITILNATKLLDMVVEAIIKLQQMLGKKIQPRILIGLYIHICCFIERMVTRTPIKTYHSLDKFVIEQENFIKLVRLCFDNIIIHYNIEFTDSEIAYIYEYIKLE